MKERWGEKLGRLDRKERIRECGCEICEKFSEKEASFFTMASGSIKLKLTVKKKNSFFKDALENWTACRLEEDDLSGEK